jgi:hypothetical protein
MTDKPYSEPLGGSYVVDKPGGKPVRKEFTEHRPWRRTEARPSWQANQKPKPAAAPSRQEGEVTDGPAQMAKARPASIKIETELRRGRRADRSGQRDPWYRRQALL